MDLGSGKNFAIIAKLSSQWLFGFQDPSVAQLIYKKGGGGGGTIHLHSFLPPRASLALSRPVPEPRSPALSPLPCPASAPAAAHGFMSCLSRPLPSLPMSSPLAVYSHRRHLSLPPRARVALFPGPQCHRSSPLPSPGTVEPWSSLCVRVVHCHSQPCTLLCPCSTLRPQTWSVLEVVTALGPGLDLTLQRWRSQALQQLQVSTLRAFIQIHSLHGPNYRP